MGQLIDVLDGFAMGSEERYVAWWKLRAMDSETRRAAIRRLNYLNAYWDEHGNLPEDA